MFSMSNQELLVGDTVRVITGTKKNVIGRVQWIGTYVNGDGKLLVDVTCLCGDTFRINRKNIKKVVIEDV